MLLTPLLPSAGPTGGDGEACPAPTMSLTITSFCNIFFDIFGGGERPWTMCCGGWRLHPNFWPNGAKNFLTLDV